MTPKSLIVVSLLLILSIAVKAQVVPPTPSGLVAEAESDTKVVVTWQDESSNEDFFILERSIFNNDNYDVIAVLGKNSTSFADAFVGPKTTYFYRVKARNSTFFGNVDSDYSNEDDVTTPGPPEPPTNLVVNTQSKTAMQINWNEGSDDTQNYNIERSANNANNFQLITTALPGSESYADNNLSSNTTYFYRVKATNEYGDSEFSNQDFDVTYQYPPSFNEIADPEPVIENSGVQTINLSGISAGGNESQILTINATSSNTGLIPNPSVNYQSPQSSGDISFTPFANKSGTAEITVTITDDGPNSPPENINNSSRKFTLIVNKALPDLVVNNLQTPDLICANQPFNVQCNVKNKGHVTSAPSKLSVYFSIGNNEIDAEDLLLGKADVQELFAGQSTPVVLNVSIFESYPNGPYYIIYKIDHDDLIEETRENNNDREDLVDLCLPDLIIENSSSSQTLLSKGQTFSVQYDLSNIGILAAGNHHVKYYLTRSQQEFGQAEEIGETSINGLGAEESTEIMESLTIPGNTNDGDYFLVFEADGKEEVIESNEENNVFYIQLTIENLPDINVAESMINPDLVAFGQTVLFSSTVENIGVEAASSSFIKYYLSSDEIFDIRDFIFGIESEIPELPVGAQHVSEALLDIPEEFEEGNYFILAIADGTYIVRENNEINNIVAHGITILSDIPPVILSQNFPEYRISGLDNTMINIQAEDDVEILSVNFKFKGIRSNIWDSTDVNLTGTNSYQVSIPGAIFDELGLEYFFEVFDDVGLKAVSDIGYTYIEYQNNGLAITGMAFGENQSDYRIISIPLELANQDVHSILEDDLGPYDKTKWRLFEFNNGIVDEYGQGLDELKLAQGYWLIVRDQTSLDTGAGKTVKTNQSNLYEITLTPGWNQIGNPYNFSIKWSDVLSVNGFPTGISGNIKVFENGFKSSDVLNSFQGGFIESNTTIKLKLPITKEEIIISGRSSSKNDSYNKGWEIGLSVSNGHMTHEINAFGMNEEAALGVDRFDETHIPQFGFLSNLSLDFQNELINDRKISKDIVALQDDYSWHINLENDTEEQYIYIGWDTGSANLGPYQKLILFDPNTGLKTDMLKSHGIWIDSKTSNELQIIYGDNTYVKKHLSISDIVVGGGYPNPFQISTKIPIALPKAPGPYQLEMTVYNQLGQKVTTLLNGSYDHGQIEAEWNGHDANGTKVKPGVYYYQVKVGNDNITKTLSGTLVHY